MAGIEGSLSGMNPENPLVILKTGRKIPSLAAIAGDYEDWIAAGMGWPPGAVRVIEPGGGEELPSPDEVAGIAITGSGAMVTERADWMQHAAHWLANAAHAQVPVLGICFGHQLLAHALGGEVDYNPRGVEVGTIEVTLAAAAADDPLFSVLPRRLKAQLSHRQSVVRLPAGATLLGSSEMEPHQGFAFGRRAWGVQFHPEFDERIIPYFVEYYREILGAQSRSVDALQAAVQPAPESQLLLRRFAQIVRGER
jgi:GMP synthase (glutamine-hydrolysing)